MVPQVRFLAIVIFGIFISNCQESGDKGSVTNNNPKTSLRQGWFPWAGYAGSVIGAELSDSLFNVNLSIVNGSEDIDPVKLVLSGENDFGITSAETLVRANQKGANLIAIGAMNFKSPTCFISKKELNIISPRDFEGYKVGILVGTETETVYNALSISLGLDSKKIQRINAPFDLNSFILSNAYDIRPAFIYDEPISLLRKGIEINIIKPEEYGIHLIGAVYFTKKSTIENDPDIVQSVVNSLALGWQKALAEPEAAIDVLKQHDKTIDSERELQVLISGKEYFGGENNMPLYASEDRWRSLKNVLILNKVIDESFDINSCFDNSFVYNVYKQELKF